MLGSFKDTAAKVAANRHPTIQRFGVVHKIHIDTAQRSIQAEITLKGEPSPLGVTLHYRVDTDGAQSQISVQSIQFSREWMDVAAHIWLERQGALVFPFEGLSAQLIQFLL